DAAGALERRHLVAAEAAELRGEVAAAVPLRRAGDVDLVLVALVAARVDELRREHREVPLVHGVPVALVLPDLALRGVGRGVEGRGELEALVGAAVAAAAAEALLVVRRERGAEELRLAVRAELGREP